MSSYISKCSRRIPRVEKNENSKIVDILFTRTGVELVSKIVVQENIFKMWRKKEENEQNHHGFLLICILLCNADTTLEYENEPSPEVFQEAKIYSCVGALVRITDDSPLLNWIPHFARRLLGKMRTCRGWKESIAQFGEEELTSFVKRIIEGVAIIIKPEQLYISPRAEWCEAKAGQDRC